MIEALLEFLLLIIISYPGAFIRRIIFRKKSFNEYLEDNWETNAFPVIIIAIVIVLLFQLLK